MDPEVESPVADEHNAAHCYLAHVHLVHPRPIDEVRLVEAGSEGRIKAEVHLPARATFLAAFPEQNAGHRAILAKQVCHNGRHGDSVGIPVNDEPVGTEKHEKLLGRVQGTDQPLVRLRIPVVGPAECFELITLRHPSSPCTGPQAPSATSRSPSAAPGSSSATRFRQTTA